MDVHPLTQIQRAFEPPPTFLSQYLLLLPPSAQAIKPPGSDILQYLYDLALQANKAAESLSCSSILAGQGNESDDTGDVALWLGSGHYGPGQEQAVLRTLGLASWLDQGAIVSKVELSSFESTLPSTLSDGSTNPQVQDLVEKLQDMTDMYCFRVNSPDNAPLVLFILLGHCVRDKTSGWGGLLGIGTWSDQ